MTIGDVAALARVSKSAVSFVFNGRSGVGAEARERILQAADELGWRPDARARALSPLATLQRGYAVLQDADGHVVTSIEGVAAKQQISVRVADGRIHATTTSTTPTDREHDG